ncbi:MAG: hypothetical protein NZP74_13210 [Anaerolineales bacterium]|nr:hypothetical protein [Anaerolineales bacterium]MDW8276554.1 hypothetical protein [Anaerolineales bacterium]
MKTVLFRLMVITILLLTGCNLPAQPAIPTTTPAASPTLATLTETPQPPTDTPAPPTETLTPSSTPTETATPEPSATPTPAPPTAKVIRESNCRIGPAGNYALVATYPSGKVLNIIARDLGGGFVFVQNPEKPEEQCYLLEKNLEISGDLALLPRITPPPTPTAAPNFTVTFWRFMLCKDQYIAHFKVVNTGDSQFRSAYVKVTDQKRKETLEQSLLAFDLYEGCIVAKNIAPLLPGGTGYVQSAPYKWDPRPNKHTAVIMLCSEQGLKGVCVTKTLEFQDR